MAEVRQRHKAKSNVKASGKGDRSPPSNSSTAVDEQPAQKNVLVAYLLYFFGGALGWHHLYLDREAQASLWSVTGGGFGFGLLFDFFRIPSYVSEANIDDVFRDSRRHRNRCQNIIRSMSVVGKRDAKTHELLFWDERMIAMKGSHEFGVSVHGFMNSTIGEWHLACAS
eukprot:m.15592 g.15592  ORF g.15592 m.15592 type:complete len:169 (-) comp6673_c0_seq2:1158-1664(-)